MKIAFIDHIPVGGGIIRYGLKLANLLAENHNAEVTYFTTEANYLTNLDLFQSPSNKIKIKILHFTKKNIFLYNFIDQLILKIIGISRGKFLEREIKQKTEKFEIAYFTCAHTADYIQIKPKCVVTMHDLNWNYLFGVPLYNSLNIDAAKDNFNNWLQNSRVICSSNFIKNEIVRVFNYKKPIDVIHLSNLGEGISNKLAINLNKYHLNKSYILYPGHLMPHKNHLNLFNAFWKLNEDIRFKDKYILALSGGGTDFFSFAKVFKYGIQHSTYQDFNVRGLGYIPNDEVDSIIANAQLVISPSLYEAGSGPALDAWKNKVPVMLSNIPSHMEQIEFNDIPCVSFDPMNPDDIYLKLTDTLINIGKIKDEVRSNSFKMDQNSWPEIAKKYFKVFEGAMINQHN